MINSDSYYEIGAGHTFCQDYATHGHFISNGKPYHYAVVSDGCSSSKDSNIGSLWMARSFPKVARQALESVETDFKETVEFLLTQRIKVGMEQLSAPRFSFDATLVAVLYDVSTDTLHNFIWGDGKIYQKLKDGSGALIDASYASNAPYYLSYQAEAGCDTEYETRFGKLYADILSYVVTDNSLVRIMELDKSFQKSFYSKVEGASKFIEFISVFTDGIDTYHLKDDVNIIMPRHNVFNQLTQYKNLHGDFVLRRMQMVKKFCEKESWRHFDDISVATLVL